MTFKTQRGEAGMGSKCSQPLSRFVEDPLCAGSLLWHVEPAYHKAGMIPQSRGLQPFTVKEPKGVKIQELDTEPVKESLLA